jgi:homoserine kinase
MFEIKAPATSANICCGFDTFGLAVTLYNTFKVEKSDKYIFDGREEDINNTNNLILTSMLTACRFLDKDPVPVKVDVFSDVPSTRGLGSSATCVVAGIIMAYKVLNVEVDIDDVFNIASSIEGHPDNVAPCIFGGTTLSYKQDDEFKYYKINANKKYRICAFIPRFKLSTKKARNVLPEKYSREDVVFNIQRASLLPISLERGDSDFVKDALQDRIHEPYRKGLISGYDDVVNLTKKYGFVGTYLSGAGPTIMGIYEGNIDLKKLRFDLRKLKDKYDLYPLKIDFNGVRY